MNRLKESEFVSALLDAGSLDVKYFIDTYNEFANICDELSIWDIVEESKNSFDKIDINSLIYVLHSTIFYSICDMLLDRAKENLRYDNVKRAEKYIQKLQDSFSPFINCMDSWFNNFLDDIKLQEDIIWKRFLLEVIKND